jgi:hypothetical protein
MQRGSCCPAFLGSFPLHVDPHALRREINTETGWGYTGGYRLRQHELYRFDIDELDAVIAAECPALIYSRD